MENSNYPQTYPGSQYFPSPLAWVDPNSVSSDDNDTPTWVIVIIVIVVVVFCGFLFYYIWRRQKKIRKTAWACAKETPKKDPPPKEETPKKDPKDPPPKKDKEKEPKKDPAPPAKPLPLCIPMSYPGSCPSCGHSGGLYSFSYTCPVCKYKMECNVVYPGKK